MPRAKTVDEMILGLPKKQATVTKRLRDIVLECLPLATEKPYYGLGVPYYARHRQICYIFPSAALYELENKKYADHVTLGFCQGNRMANDDGVLIAEGRKQVRVMYFNSAHEIKDEIIRALLFEASMIDDSFKKGKA